MNRRYLVAALLCIGIGIVCLAFVGCSLKSAQIAHVGLGAGDLVSTHHAESRGGVEVNPILASVEWPTRIVIKSVTAAGVLYLTHKIGREHQTAAKTVLTAINLVMAGVIANNLRVKR